MKGLDRLRSAAKGDFVSPKPVIVWSVSPGHSSDGIVATVLTLEDSLRSHPDQAVLVEVLSPYGKAYRDGVNLTDLVTSQPDSGANELAKWALAVKTEIVEAYEAGAHGIFYRLDGAYPTATTPMQFGGFYLETDREILSQFFGRGFQFLFVEGEEAPYLDFVSDLPADAFGWDAPRTKISVDEVRSLRAGALAVDNSAADILFVKSQERAEALMGGAE